MGKLTLILGGARSGKSTLAEKLAAKRGENILYVATALPFDDEMKNRIESHRERRPQTWKTIESPTKISSVIQDDLHFADLVLLDCMTLLVNNLFFEISGGEQNPDEDLFAEVLQQEVDDLLATIKISPGEWIVVTNEVGLGLVPPYPLGRVYRDLLGWANQRLAAQAEQIYMLVAGLVLPLHQLAIEI